MELVKPETFVDSHPELFRNRQAFYEAVRRGHFEPIVRLGKKIFVDMARFDEWRQRGGTPLQKAA